MKKITSVLSSLACALALSAVSTSHAATLAFDTASNSAYSGGWSNGSNGGTGFGAWSLSSANGGGNYLGGTGLGATTFGIYSSSGGTSSADRPFTGGALAAGQTFSIDLGNTSIPSGNIGLNLMNGSTVVFTLKFVTGTSFWQLNNGGSDFNTNIPFSSGTDLKVSFTYNGGSGYDIVLNQNNGTTVYNGLGHVAANNISNITGVRVFTASQGSGENVGANNLQIVPEPTSLALLLGAAGMLGLRRRSRI